MKKGRYNKNPITQDTNLAEARIDVFRKEVKAYRKANKMTNQQLADECDVNKYLMADFMANKTNLSALSLAKIINGTGINL